MNSRPTNCFHCNAPIYVTTINNGSNLAFRGVCNCDLPTAFNDRLIEIPFNEHYYFYFLIKSSALILFCSISHQKILTHSLNFNQLSKSLLNNIILSFIL